MSEKSFGQNRGKNILLIAGLFLVSLAVLIIGFVSLRGTAASGTVRIYIDGKIAREDAIVPGRLIEIRQENGSVNVIRMTKDGFCMHSSTCPNQLCVQQGEVTKANYATRTLGNRVICIPNRVTVELVLDQTETVNPDIPDA